VPPNIANRVKNGNYSDFPGWANLTVPQLVPLLDPNARFPEPVLASVPIMVPNGQAPISLTLRLRNTSDTLASLS
jgi:hypothetical protein